MGPQRKQLSRLNTNPVDLLSPASDLHFLQPTGSATGLLAKRCPWKDLHLLDSINQFHRDSRSRIPIVTSLFTTATCSSVCGGESVATGHPRCRQSYRRFPAIAILREFIIRRTKQLFADQFTSLLRHETASFSRFLRRRQHAKRKRQRHAPKNKDRCDMHNDKQSLHEKQSI